MWPKRRNDNVQSLLNTRRRYFAAIREMIFKRRKPSRVNPWTEKSLVSFAPRFLTSWWLLGAGKAGEWYPVPQLQLYEKSRKGGSRVPALGCNNESEMSLSALMQCRPELATLPSTLPQEAEFETKEWNGRGSQFCAPTYPANQDQALSCRAVIELFAFFESAHQYYIRSDISTPQEYHRFIIYIRYLRQQSSTSKSKSAWLCDSFIHPPSG